MLTVDEIVVRDGRSGVEQRQRFHYSNGYYDGQERQFRGFEDVVVETDGDDTTSSVSLPDLMGLVRGSSVTIYPIAFTGSYRIGDKRSLSARSFVQQLADISGGAVFLPRTSKDLPTIYNKILEELSSQYVLGFVSDNTKHDGKFRKLHVDVGRPGLKVRHRQGYLAPKG